jgi:anti-anti-sigma regulatory factor
MEYTYNHEAVMTFCTEGTVSHLQGDLSRSGVTHGSISSLADSLHLIASGHEKNLRIDCGRIHAADMGGLQLLYVWMQCARIRGVEPVLFNLSASLQHAMRMTGLEHCFAAENKM